MFGSDCSLLAGGLTLESFCIRRAGGPLESEHGECLLPMPPVGTVLDQRMTQKVSSANGDKKKQSFLDRDLFVVNSSVTDDAVTLHGFDVTVQLESPASSKYSNCIVDSLLFYRRVLLNFALRLQYRTGCKYCLYHSNHLQC